MSPTARFCPECAHPAGASNAPPLAERFGSPESYTPKSLAERIRTSKSSVEGERKHVTVLFADLKGSMEIIADRDPEIARMVLDSVVERMMEAVHRYEGTVTQVMGDGIMALFGAPLAHEDHAIRACYAALRMQEAAQQYAGEIHRTEGVPIQIRIGLNSGEVVVRSISGDLHMDYTAVGQTTHVAARLEQMAMPGSVLISPQTLRLVEGYVVAKPLGPRPIKGLERPLDVYELTAATAVRSRFQAVAARGLTRFVGREAEVEQLRHALHLAAAGHGQVVAIVGEAGVGKSRLFYEFIHSHRVHGWLILESGSVSYGKAAAYLPIINLLKEYFKIQDRDGHREMRDKVIGRVLGLDRSLEVLLLPLLALMDVPTDDPGWEALDPIQRRQRTLEAVKRLLLRESQVQPLLLVIEDLHWIDGETQALLDNLADSLGSRRMLLLVNYRPEYEHRWGKKTYYTQLRLERLLPERTSELLHALLGEAGELEPLKQMLRRRGNPFFLEETIRTLVETKALAGEQGAYRLVRPVHILQIPATVQTMLAARIDRLPMDEKQLLQAASVIGKDVPYTILAPVVELSPDVLRRGLAHLQEAEFLCETGLFPDPEYTFKHALTHEVTYASLLRDRQRILHGRIVDTIERLCPDRVLENIERLAHHAFQSEEWAKAITYLRQAGTKAFARSANREALPYFEKALTALTHLPQSRETLQQAIDVRFDIRNALFPLAEWGRIEEYLRQAEQLAKTLDDQRRLGWVSAYMCSHQLQTGGHASDVRTFAQKVAAIGEALSDIPQQIAAQYYLVMACYLSGDYRRTEQVCRSLIESLEGERAHERFGVATFPAVLSRAYLARTLAERGIFDEGEVHGKEAIRIGEAVDHPYSVIFACLWLAYVDGIKGESSRAVRLLERALAECRDWNVAFLTPLALASLGHVYASSGRIREGITLLQEALKIHETAGIGYFESTSAVQIGEAYLLAGQVEDARARADQAVTLSRKRGERGHEAWSLRLLGEIASHSDMASAEAHYSAALALASELEMHPLVAHCHVGLGNLSQKTGKLEEAQEHLTTATSMYRKMDMRFWLQRERAERHQSG
jgi:class 3 adenylate cyclase/tetratricopeptide (TPR) repeat protein